MIDSLLEPIILARSPVRIETSALELLGVAFNLACVILTIRRHIACWPVGIVGIALFFAMFFRAKLYADLLNLTVQFLLSLYGWRAWLVGGVHRGPLVVRQAPPAARAVMALAVAAGAPAFGFSLARWTDAAFPYWDSLITVLSLAAQTALSRKWLDAWVLWIAVDAIAIPVYAARGLWFAAALYAVFLVMAVGGLGTWWKALHTA